MKDKNPYVNKVLDWKMKYDESDNAVLRASRLLTDKVTYIIGGLFQKTELSETLTEICKLDPNFSRIQFLKDCETDFIPNILEAMVRGDLEILKDWCHEAPYNVIAQPLKEVQKLGYRLDSKILGIKVRSFKSIVFLFLSKIYFNFLNTIILLLKLFIEIINKKHFCCRY